MLKDIPTIFAEALEIASATDRDAYLARECGEDSSLRQRINQLLQDHARVARAGGFLQEPAFAATIMLPSVSEGPGTMIGPYKLLEQIGEGGFGVVFMAEQLRPLRRKVALKVIKPGMDTKQVVARFEAERQSLALMDNPNIARVLDAGTTESGRPYFVMELVRGIPITAFCDELRLSTRERLGLFVDVCRAIQHAHQKGIIHRDIKPSNVLVTQLDGAPLVKVIDFGIAKAMGQQLTDKSLFTGFAQLIGTPLYMSPEQAAMNAADVDTRCDVYSLGVLLYELMTGTTPFDKEILSKSSQDEWRRIIREDDPPRPSARISTLEAAARSTISDRRQIDPQKLDRQIRGELDWIVMKALEKDRNRRYESASAFAADVQRYLDDEAVEAGPVSTFYRLRKYARRRKAFLTGTILVVTALIAGTVIASWQATVAIQAQAEANRQREDAEKNLELALAAVDRLLQQVDQDTLPPSPQFDAIRSALLEEAMNFYKRLLAQHGETPAVQFSTARAWLRIAGVQYELTRFDEADSSYAHAFTMLEKLITHQPAEASYLDELADAQLSLAFADIHFRWDASRADKYLRRAKELYQALETLEPTESDHRFSLLVVEENLERLNGLEEQQFRRRADAARAISLQYPQKTSFRDHLARAERELATCLASHAGPAEEISKLYDSSAALFEQGLREGGNERQCRIELAYLLYEKSSYFEKAIQIEQAEQALHQALEHMDLLHRNLRLGHHDEAMRAMFRIQLGELLERHGRLDEAEQAFQMAFDDLTDSAWGQQWHAAEHLTNLLMRQQRAETATRVLSKLILTYQAELREASGELRPEPLLVVAELMRLEATGSDVISVDAALANVGMSRFTSAKVDPAEKMADIAWTMTSSKPAAFPRTAVALAERAVLLQPDRFLLHRMEGIARYRAQDYASAVACLNRAIQRKPDEQPTAWLFLAMAFQQQHNHASAREWYTKAIAWIENQPSISPYHAQLRDEAKSLIEQ